MLTKLEIYKGEAHPLSLTTIEGASWLKYSKNSVVISVPLKTKKKLINEAKKTSASDY